MTYDTKEHDNQTCTCFSIDERDHDFECDLWKSPGWRAGLLVWDFGLRTLVADAEMGDYYKMTDEEIQELAGDVWDEDEIADLLEGEEEEDDELPECTCYDPDMLITLKQQHGSGCDLFSFQDWVEQQCEWDHINRRFLWYKDGEDSMMADPVLTERPKHLVKNENDKGKEVSGGKTTTGGNSAGSWDDKWAFAKCRHYEEPVTFPDGTVVRASSKFDRKPNQSVPDYAVYLDDWWKPTSIATFLPWKDHGMPTIRWDHAAGVIVDAFERARDGLTVEVGCIGGHGRTGTVLACMAVLSGVPVGDACEWVWENYCEHAIEVEDQIWWVFWFAAYIYGWEKPAPLERLRTSAEPPPPPPPPKKVAGAAKSEPTQGSWTMNGVVGQPDPDVPKCLRCGEKRNARQNYICNNNKCSEFYGLRCDSPRGKKLLRKWKKRRKK